MAKSVERFKTWLTYKRNFLFSRYTKDAKTIQELERSLIKLPVEIRKELVSKIENLARNPADKKATFFKLDEAYELWRNNPHNKSLESIKALAACNH